MSNNDTPAQAQATDAGETNPADATTAEPQAGATATGLSAASPEAAPAPDGSATAPLPAPATTPSSSEDTWELPGGKPPESPAQPKDAKDLPVTPEQDVWSGQRRAGTTPGSAPPPAAADAAPRGVRASTLVWGLVLLVLGGLLLAVSTGIRIDLVTAMIALLAGVGVALLIMALVPQRKADAPGTGA
ncbi:hypothetical protein GZ998_00080 [Actinomyces sp. 594]|uniref:hypothetical protein n=1 Tax=Actinomyces sp. 594 TaxID=2057793 RepID=UPI001C591192|nr:hypothetical protein [Actinomyces sp. 594]MBW3067917.1 hypothetical protein [Actinomyces sp. 594]